ncbi:unnamed protein product [Musa acuminata subsp. burmannicoides]
MSPVQLRIARRRALRDTLGLAPPALLESPILLTNTKSWSIRIYVLLLKLPLED